MIYLFYKSKYLPRYTTHFLSTIKAKDLLSLFNNLLRPLFCVKAAAPHFPTKFKLKRFFSSSSKAAQEDLL